MLESLDEAARLQRRLVQDASHELRTPLTSLRTNIELLASRDKDLSEEDRKHLLRDLVEQLGEMTVLIGELTELARGEEQKPAPEEVRLDLVAQAAIRRATRNHPEVPIVARLDPTTIAGGPEVSRTVAYAVWPNSSIQASTTFSFGTRLSQIDDPPRRLRADAVTEHRRGVGLAVADVGRPNRRRAADHVVVRDYEPGTA